jgi:hypothetical protein
MYDMVVRGQANAKANGRDIIEPWDLPVRAGLQENIHQFRKLDAQIELQPILDDLTSRPAFDVSYSDETYDRLPAIAGGISVALGRAMTMLDPKLKVPQTEHWERATRLFDVLL